MCIRLAAMHEAPDSSNLVNEGSIGPSRRAPGLNAGGHAVICCIILVSCDGRSLQSAYILEFVVTVFEMLLVSTAPNRDICVQYTVQLWCISVR
jgi:hypothetical protein